MNCEIIDRYFNEFFVEIQLQKENFGHLGVWAPNQVHLSPKHLESVTEDSDPSHFDKMMLHVKKWMIKMMIKMWNFQRSTVKYANSCSIKCYIGECISKDSDTELTFIFIERVGGFSDTEKM